MDNNNPFMVLLHILEWMFLTFYVKFLTPIERLGGDDMFGDTYINIYPKQMLIEYCSFKSSHTYRVRFNKDGHLCLYDWGELSKPLRPNGKLEMAFKAYYSKQFEDIIL